jgi:uncharacterized protein YdeI (YjbR/CyaY-like superfamily)
MATPPNSTPGVEQPVILFEDQAAWAAWLEQQHTRSSGLWLRLAKQASGLVSVSYHEALEVALCYGWIDGQKKRYDECSWLQKFTPRGPKSLWSRINTEKAERLITQGRMQPAGLKAIEAVKQDGRWEAAYDSQRTATVPSDLQAELEQHPQAQAFFATLDRQNRYAILFRIQTARKAETRVKRIQQVIEMLEKHEKLYP